MSLNQRIAFSSSLVLLFFFATIIVFTWSNGQRREAVDDLQTVLNAQYQVNDISEQLGGFGRKLRVIDALRETRGEAGLDEGEKADLKVDVDFVGELIDQLDAGYTAASGARLEGVELSRDVVSTWKNLLATERLATAAPLALAIENFQRDYQALASRLNADRIALRARALQLNEQLDATEALTRKITLGVFAFSVLVSIVLIWRLVRYTRRSLSSLREGTRQWGKGNFEYQVSVPGKTDLAELAGAFNRMAGRLKSAVEQVQAERARADKANEAKSAFLANMSHELRTPMNAVIGYSEMILEDIEDGMDLDPDEVKPDLEKIRNSGHFLLSLINDVLDLSKIESGKMTVFYEQADAVSVIDEVLQTIQPLVDKHGNTLVRDVDFDPREITTDVTKFRQILLNLLSNASKFTKQGTITVTARRVMTDDGEIASVAISDTGIGMTPEQMAKVFDEFEQADASTTREYGGTGLGLTICRRFAEMMGGGIIVMSEPGAGSTFTLKLPVEQALQAAPGEDDEQAGTREDGDALAHILVIDDDENAREISRRILERQGYRVSTVASGARGLEFMREEKPDLVVLDVMMAGMDGWQVLEKLRADPETAAVPVIMQSMLDERELGLSLGADEYLTKPVDRKRLSKAVRRSLPAGDEERVILVVERNADVRAHLEKVFQGEAAHIVTLGTLEDVEDLIDEQAVDLVLVGHFDHLEALGALIQRTDGLRHPHTTPILSLETEEPADERADHLVGYVRQQLAQAESKKA